MKSAKILVFTATYNEIANIGLLLDQIASSLPAADILVVDDNSPDGTWELIQSKAVEYSQLRSVRRPRKLGIGSAHKYALIYAIRNGYQTLITMDADLSHQAEMLPILLKAHGENVFVTGSRYCAGGFSDYTGYRNVVSRLGNFVARFVLRVSLKELTTYFRVFDVASLRKLPLRYINAAGYSFGVQIIFYLNRVGVELREVPIHFRDRTRGASKIPKLQILVSAIDLFRLAVSRLGSGRNAVPDEYVEDNCQYCHDRALTMAKHNSKIYVCLCCMREQVPNRFNAAI